jgi:RimJ/RimL family protein N-acetyltransferase
MAEFRIETERLILREWRDADIEPFAAMCADPRVMETLGPLMSRDETVALIARVRDVQAMHGHTFWATERLTDARFLGWCGIIRGNAGPIDGKAEIGWRIAADAWGQGYAREAAQAALAWGFANLPDDRIWAITSTGNTRSWGLMERLGMVRHADLDFDHPKVADDSPLKRHVTYSIGR